MVGAAMACSVVKRFVVGESVCGGYTLEAYGRITRRGGRPSRVDQHITSLWWWPGRLHGRASNNVDRLVSRTQIANTLGMALGLDMKILPE